MTEGMTESPMWIRGPSGTSSPVMINVAVTADPGATLTVNVIRQAISFQNPWYTLRYGRI
jgi:hypothetical protein